MKTIASILLVLVTFTSCEKRHYVCRCYNKYPGMGPSGAYNKGVEVADYGAHRITRERHYKKDCDKQLNDNPNYYQCKVESN